MFCSNCGIRLDESASFCTNCGTKASMANEQQILVEDAEVSCQEKISEPEINDLQDPIFPKKPKRKVFLPVIIIAVVIIAILGFVFKDSVMATFAPKLYAENVLLKTVKQITNETVESEKELYGFDLNNQDEITYEIEATLDKISDEEFNGIGGKLTMSKSDKKKALSMSGELLYDSESPISFLASLNDENIVFDIPQLFEESLSVSSKTFGKDWNKSKIGRESDIELSDDLDLSYTNLSKEELFSEETNDALKEVTKNFIKQASVESSKSSAEVGRKTVKTRLITVTVSNDSLEDYLVDVVKIIGDDENIKGELGSDTEDEWDDIISDLCDGIEEICKNLDGDFSFSMDVYKGYVARLFCESEIEEADIFMEVSFRDNKKLINNIYMLLEIKVDGEKMVVEVESVGDRFGENGIFTDETTVEIVFPYSDKMKIESTSTMDFKSGVFEGDFSASVDGEEMSVSYEGTCSNKKAFEIELDKIKIKSNEYSDDVTIKGNLSVSIIPNADVEVRDVKDSLKLFDSSEDDITDWEEDVFENAQKLMEEYAEELSALWFEDSAYYDDYNY